MDFPVSEEERALARVLIAKDVLTRLPVQLTAARGNYVVSVETAQHFTPTMDAKEVLSTLPCEVCALGGLFIGAVCSYDELPLGNLLTYPDELIRYRFIDTRRKNIFPYLQRFFSDHQLDLIEVTFEGQPVPGVRRTDFSDEAWDAAMEFHHRHIGPNTLLEAICKNIIENEGTFVP